MHLQADMDCHIWRHLRGIYDALIYMNRKRKRISYIIDMGYNSFKLWRNDITIYFTIGCVADILIS